MKNRIIEICELGQPKSIIHRENQPISELIKTTELVEELNKQLLLHNVSQQRELLIAELKEWDLGWTSFNNLEEKLAEKLLKSINCG